MQEVVTTADLGESPRARVARLVASTGFQEAIVAVILFNAVILGLETSGSIMAEYGGLLRALDAICLWIFTAELAARIYAFRGRYFRDPWGIFDLVIVGIAWLPASGPLAVLRTLRILRVLRLVSVLPSLRVVVGAMLKAVPSMGSIVALMVLIFYVCAVAATKLFGEVLPERFGTLGDSLMSLFQLMTMEGWVGDIVFPVMEQLPWSWLFFIPFIIVSTFVVLNLFIGVIVDSIQSLREQREEVSVAHVEAREDSRMILQELRALRAEVAALRARGAGD